MEDTNFNKFICYILNYINAPDNRVVYINHENKFMQRNYTNDGGGVLKSPVDYPSALDSPVDDSGVDAELKIEIAVGAAGVVAADVAAAAANFKLITDLNNIKQYFNFKRLPKYILGDTNKKLDVSKCIFNTFNLIKTYFDAKKWYLQQYQNFTNSRNYLNPYFNSETTRTFYGGFNVVYDATVEKVEDTTYDKLLANILKDIIYMVSDDTESIDSFDGITLYILTKINHYLAKRYAVLSLDNSKGHLTNALKKYAEAVAYDNEFLNNFTYYTGEINTDDYPRYYQKELLELLNAGSATIKKDDMTSFNLIATTKKNINDLNDDMQIIQYIVNYNYLTWYKSYFKDDEPYNNVYNKVKETSNLLNQIRQNLIHIITKNKISTLTEKKVKTIYDKITFETSFDKYDEDIKNIIKHVISAILGAAATGVAIATAAVAPADAAAAGTAAAGVADLIDGVATDDIKEAIKIAAAAAAGAVYNFKVAVDAAVDAGAAVAGAAVADAAVDAAVAGAAAGTAAVVDAAAGRAAVAVDAALRIANNVIIAVGGAATEAANAANDAIRDMNIVGNDADAYKQRYNIYATAFAAAVMTNSNVLNKIVKTNMEKIKDANMKNTIQSCIKNSIVYKNEEFIKKKINTSIYTIDNRENINEQIRRINDKYKQNHIAMLFKLIKSKTKKYTKNRSSSVYQSPTFTYSVTPINIRPLVYKRATETDLSNYAAQIASDSFINNNQLPTIPDFKSIDKVIGLLGGAPDINNSSNVYRTIFNKILNALNAKRIKLNDDDREIVDKKLNDLEEIEQYLKSTLSDYAKYASVTHEKGTIVGNIEIRNFLNDYENKLREYNKKSASIVRFIGRLTPYLYSY